jgi:hypothetical protein
MSTLLPGFVYTQHGGIVIDYESQSSIEWKRTIRHHLKEYNCKLNYDKDTEEQILIFDTDEDATAFILKWS